jgi:hypothetical protein
LNNFVILPGMASSVLSKIVATLLYAFFENIDFHVILCTNVTKDVSK